MYSGSNCDRKPPLSDILTEQLNPRAPCNDVNMVTEPKLCLIKYDLDINVYYNYYFQLCCFTKITCAFLRQNKI